MARKIIHHSRPDALNYFEEEIFDKESTKTAIKFHCRALGTLDDRGEFTRVVLRELYDLNTYFKQIQGDRRLEKEFNGLLELFYRLGNRKASEKIDLTTNGDKIRCAVMLAAVDYKGDSFEAFKSNPEKSGHVIILRKYFDDKISSIWVLAQGKDQVSYAKQIIEYIKNDERIYKIFPQEFEHYFTNQPNYFANIKLKQTEL
jgi:hypothetical protein